MDGSWNFRRLWQRLPPMVPSYSTRAWDLSWALSPRLPPRHRRSTPVGASFLAVPDSAELPQPRAAALRIRRRSIHSCSCDRWKVASLSSFASVASTNWSDTSFSSVLDHRVSLRLRLGHRKLTSGIPSGAVLLDLTPSTNAALSRSGPKCRNTRRRHFPPARPLTRLMSPTRPTRSA